MATPVRDDVWTRRGISVLWDGEAFNQFAAQEQVISLRYFFDLYRAEWPEEEHPRINENSETIVVAGLDAAIDALSPKEAESWLEKKLYPAIIDYQETIGGDGALIFWMADGKRWKHRSSDHRFFWNCGGQHRGSELPLGRCLWNGAETDAQLIEPIDNKGKSQWIGIYHRRIS